MATIYALVLRSPRLKDGLCPVHLRLTSARSPKYQAVPNVALSAAHWNEKGSLEKANWVCKTHPYAADYNETLRKLLKRVQQLVDDNPTWECEQVRTALNGSGTQDFLAHMRLDVARRVQAGPPMHGREV
jgi:hypothetical protein